MEFTISSTAATSRGAEFRSWRALALSIPVLGMYRTPEGVVDRDKLRRAAESAAWVHQRCYEHVHLFERELWIPEGGYGHPHRRPEQYDEHSHQDKYHPSNALVGQRCSA